MQTLVAGRDDIDSRLEFSMTSLFFVLSKIYLLQPHAFLLIIIVQNKGEIDLADQKNGRCPNLQLLGLILG